MNLYYFDEHAKDVSDQKNQPTKSPSTELMEKQKRLDELTPFQFVVKQAKSHCSKSEDCKNCPLNCKPL